MGAVFELEASEVERFKAELLRLATNLLAADRL